MAVIVRWVPPDEDSDWNQVKIYRDTSATGLFATLVATVPVSVNHYFDISGSSLNFYKISFYKSSSSTESEKSDPVRGGYFLGYCVPQDIYDFTNIECKKIDELTLSKYIELATAQINRDISVEICKEVIRQVDDTKLNTINGVNTTFYTQNYPIGDLNNDGEVTTEDIKVYSIDVDGTRTELSVTSITPNTGQFVLSSAPTTTDLARIELEYVVTPVTVHDPHPLVRLACIYLAAGYAYSKINIGKAKSMRFGTMSFIRHLESVDEYMKKYDSIIFRINNKMADIIHAPDLTLQQASLKYGNYDVW